MKTKRAEKVIEGHRGQIYQVEFSADSEKVFSAADDGRVLIWEWRTGALVGSFIRHPAAVRCFDFNYDRPDRIICGRSDGHITAWDVATTLQVDDIIPDPEWMQDGTERNLMAWVEPERHHTGSILAVRISPNNLYLATGATDNTCKLWSVSSYQREHVEVQHELQEDKRISEKLDAYIDVTDEATDIQLKMKDFSGLKVGEVPIALGYHADLRFTYRHEGPVLAIFSIKAHTKEEDLPSYWQRQEVKNAIAEAKKPQESSEEDEEEGEEEMGEEEMSKSLSIPELRTMISHGLVLPSFLNTLLDQYKSVDSTQLFNNMRKFDLRPRHILRLIVNNKFHPRDILTALATKSNPEGFYHQIAQGTPITAHMVKMGFQLLDDEKEEEGPNIFLNYGDIKMRKLGFGVEGARRRRRRREAMPTMDGLLTAESRGGGYVGYDEWEIGDEQDYDYYAEDEEAWDDWDKMQQYVQRQRQPRGKVLHFIPSEQIKLLKDFHANRDLKPIFLRDLVLDLNPQAAYPNFSVEGEPMDTRVM
ncbi:hypothetical protein HK097_003052 [Rhizophlyctis rosea]|uniref:Uncharacterized protein n=1 Tax=Rhizophlyctis rosea TaxID=64517 RepID=A0AAD5X9Z5_9FUNG|nr:hypothetical protein HK097_003052 [Rhizophlyctis rosea]